jgi:hypothetical protein
MMPLHGFTPAVLRRLWLLWLPVLLLSCTAARRSYNPDRQFTKQELQADFSWLRQVLEDKHPSLYWYTPKDSMDRLFDSLYRSIPDSMTELRFGWKLLAPLTHAIRCGHTSFSMSKNWGRFIRGKRIPSFPLFIKTWGDTMVVTGNLHPKDSVLKPGTLLTSINGLSVKDIRERIFAHMPLDGYAENVNYIRVSANFPYYHRNVFGISSYYRVGYIDSAGNRGELKIPVWMPEKDTMAGKPPRQARITTGRQRRKEWRESMRSFHIDTALRTGFMTLNTFSNGQRQHLRRFFRRSFRAMRELEIKHFVLDLRGNGGGDVNISSLLTRYIRTTPFKVADSVYSRKKNFHPFTKRVRTGFFSNLALMVLTRKRADGFYHFGYWERHRYRPKEKNHFNGKTWVLINGPTFSASTLFCNAVKGQKNVTLLGEEAGGGWHGNNGIMIPDITLPHTRLRVRLPFFRLVQFNHVPKNGRGVQPDIWLPPSVEGIRKAQDRKMMLVKSLISAEE